jgi:hypothetical protein
VVKAGSGRWWKDTPHHQQEPCRLRQRVERGWIDTAPARRDVALPSLAIVLPADETFARD